MENGQIYLFIVITLLWEYLVHRGSCSNNATKSMIFPRSFTPKIDFANDFFFVLNLKMFSVMLLRFRTINEGIEFLI